MPILPRVHSFFRSLFARGELERDLDEELQSYFDLVVREKVASGMDPEQARYAARRELGGVEQVKERVRQGRIGFQLEVMGRDIRYAGRSLRRAFGLTAVAVVILSLGIGATTAVFSTVQTVLSGRLPFPQPDRLILGQKYYRTRPTSLGTVSAHDFVDFRERLAECADLAAVGSSTELTIVVEAGTPLAAELTYTSWNLFSALGVQPILGRDFRAEDESGAAQPVIISHAFWSRACASDPAVIDRDLEIDGELRTVIGVMPPGFRLLNDADLWTPFRLGEDSALQRDQHNFRLLGRLHAGTSLERAGQECDAVARALEQEYPDSNADKALRIQPLHDYLAADLRPTTLLFMATTVLFLLIVCSNVAGLLLARAQTRSPGIAVRSALGASRARLVRQLLTESMLLTLVAGVIGVGLASVGLDMLIGLLHMDQLGIGLPRIDGGIFFFTFLLTVLCGILVGLTPALQGTGISPGHHLLHGSRSSTGLRGTRTRNVLTVLQTAVSLVLLVLTGLLFQSMLRMVRVDPGFETRNLLTATVQIPPEDYPSASSRWQFFADLLDEIEALPGVVSAGVIDKLPLADRWGDWGVWPADRPPPASSAEITSALTRMILPGYFEAMGMPLLAGRDIATADAFDSLSAAVVNETLAERFWPGEDPIGRIILLGGSRTGLRIVGLVRDAHLQDLRAEPSLAIYVPYTIWPGPRLRLALRTDGPPPALAEPVRSTIRGLNAKALFTDPESFESICGREFADLNIILCTLGVLALACVLLTMIGLYGGLSYQVNRRRRELGIRMALGATPRALSVMIIRSGVTLAGVGLIIGILAACPAAMIIKQFLFETGPWNILSYAGAALVLGVVALLASALPARRAIRTDPVKTLRTE